MISPNWQNRTMWTGDNLEIMRGMNSASVDLIYLDPPFNSNRTYSAPIGSEAAGAAFKDAWTLDDVDLAWHGEIAEREPPLYAVIDAAGQAHGTGMKSYLIMMGVRLLEMRRLLKDTGSIYLHCDPTASHYLKVLMDGIFGHANFRNEVVWFYPGREMHISTKFNSKHDILLFYAKSPAAKVRMENVAVPYDRAERLKGLRRKVHKDESGREWVWETRGQAKGQKPYRRYVDEIISKGRPLSDVWDEFQFLRGNHPERTGYPTQKPLALLDRIIRASSNPADIIFDPFCGCATACVAADRLERQWVGIDLSPLAAQLVETRMRREGSLLFKAIRRDDIPRRTDVASLPNYRTHKHTLYGKQEGNCIGCRTHFPFRNLTVDHVVPQAKGGTDHPDNLQLLCGACNSMKGTGTQEELIAKLVAEGIRAA